MPTGTLACMDDDMNGISPPKVKNYRSVAELLRKLEGRAAMWERVARENQERAEDFERAAQEIRNGATSVVVGRTTYVLGE